MNKLDGKCIVDRDTLKAVIDILDANCASFSDFERRELRKALAQDLTGFVATVAEPTREMAYAGRNARLNTYIPPIMDASVGDKISFRAMLNASPPLGGGGE
jgi:hypothetical protein